MQIHSRLFALIAILAITLMVVLTDCNNGNAGTTLPAGEPDPTEAPGTPDPTLGPDEKPREAAPLICNHSGEQCGS